MGDLILEDIERPEHLEQPEIEDEAPIQLKPKQDAFIFDGSAFTAYGGGIGNGKTLAGILKVYNHCIEQPGTFFLIGRRHATDLRDSTEKDFLQMMRGYGRFAPSTHTFKFPNGSEVIFRHLDDLQALTNMNLSGFWIDQAEEVPEEAFDYLTGRCRRQKGLTGAPITDRPKFITFNPNGHDWIWRLFDQGLTLDGMKLPNASDYKLWTATTFENKDNLPEDYLKSLEGKPKEWYDRFVLGSFDVKAGRIYDEFNPAIHVIGPEHYFSIPESWEHFRAIDHGQNNPTACLWMAVDFDKNIWVYDEYYRPNDTVSNHVRFIKDKSNSIDKNLDPTEKGDRSYNYTIIDPSTSAKTREKDGFRFSIAHEYMDAGVYTMPGQNDVLAGINRVKEYFRVDPERMHPFLKVRDIGPGHPLMQYNLDRDPDQPVLGSPRVFIFARAENLIREIPEYAWQPLKYSQIGQQNSHEKPVKNNDHAADAFRYAIMSRPVAPEHVEQVDPGIWQDPLRLAKYAKTQGMTVGDLAAQRFRLNGHIRKSSGGISVRNHL